MGALCCVATRPLEEKHGREARDDSADRGEPYWQPNSSFSSPPSRLWACRLNSDGLSRHFHGINGMSHGKFRHSSRGSKRLLSHSHLVSDGSLSIEDSPPDVQESRRWISPLHKSKDDEVGSSSLGGSRSAACPYSCPHKRFSAAKAAVKSPSFSSSSPLSEFATWGSTAQQPFRSQHFSGRHTYTSKAVYPIVFDNPVSDYKASGGPDTTSSDILTPEISPTYLHEIGLKFHGPILSESRKSKMSPELEMSPRREGFSWSSASSFGPVEYDGERQGDLVDHSDAMSTMLSLCDYSTPDQKCGICGKLLWKKSPWSLNRVLWNNDMPIAGVLPCSHVFHADCLEHVTPKTHVHDPLCPVCEHSVGQPEESTMIKEFLHVAPRCLRRNGGVMLTDAAKIQPDRIPSHRNKHGSARKWGVVGPCEIGSSNLKNPFRKHRSVKQTLLKDVSEDVREAGSSSSLRRVPGRVL